MSAPLHRIYLRWELERADRFACIDAGRNQCRRQYQPETVPTTAAEEAAYAEAKRRAEENARRGLLMSRPQPELDPGAVTDDPTPRFEFDIDLLPRLPPNWYGGPLPGSVYNEPATLMDERPPVRGAIPIGWVVGATAGIIGAKAMLMSLPLTAIWGLGSEVVPVLIRIGAASQRATNLLDEIVYGA